MDWTRGHTIGRGSTATVSTATCGRSGDTFAVKSNELSKSQSLRREQKILSNLDCPHVIGYKGCDITLENGRTMFNLVMEYASGGTVLDAIRRCGGGIDESTVGYYTSQVVRGLEYLHSRGIVHCDIKGSNILVTKGVDVKIADFGCAKAENEPVIGGTPMFMAPEVARGEEQGFPADVWALGCTVIEMSTGNSPWPNEGSTLHRIAFSGEPPEIPAKLSSVAKDFLNKCLRVYPKQRWTAKQLLRHPFLDEFRSSHLKQSTDSSSISSTGSPTSILDPGIWNCTEGGFSQASDELDCSTDSSDSSPTQRLKELSVNSGGRNWEWEECWITVRDSEDVNFQHFR